jgi:hypothetical protein
MGRIAGADGDVPSLLDAEDSTRWSPSGGTTGQRPGNPEAVRESQRGKR